MRRVKEEKYSGNSVTFYGYWDFQDMTTLSEFVKGSISAGATDFKWTASDSDGLTIKAYKVEFETSEEARARMADERARVDQASAELRRKMYEELKAEFEPAATHAS